MMNASSFETVMTSSTIFKCRLFGTKPAPVPWILWGPGFNGSPFQGLQDHRRIFRLNSDRFKFRFPLFDHFGDASDSAPCSDGGDKNIDFAVGVGPDLFGRGCW